MRAVIYSTARRASFSVPSPPHEIFAVQIAAGFSRKFVERRSRVSPLLRLFFGWQIVILTRLNRN
jgi:hypothetical protein